MLRQPADRLCLYVKVYVFLFGSIKPETFKPLFNLGKVYFFSLCVNTFPSTQHCTDNTSFPLFTPDRHVETFLRGMHFDQDLVTLPLVKLPYLGGPVVMSFPKNSSI